MGMNADVKSKWVNRLCSNQDEQGKSYLNCDNKLCCLGVLCEIAVEEGVITKTEPDDSGVVHYGPARDCALLPETVAEWAGLNGTVDLNGAVNPVLFESSYTRASDLNDEYGMTFQQIALIINDKL